MSGLVLSVFPGLDLLGRAFEGEGFCVVRGPDILLGWDVRAWRPLPGVFDGVIGGPPCQAHSRLANLVRHVHGPESVAPDMMPEFERLVGEAQPRWWLCENVPEAPVPRVAGYEATELLLDNRWCPQPGTCHGAEQQRVRRFTFGARTRAVLKPILACLEHPSHGATVCASGGREVPAAIGGSGKMKARASIDRERKALKGINGSRECGGTAHLHGYKTRSYAMEAARLQGLSEAEAKGLIDLLGVRGAVRVVGNAVPLTMGRTVAKAVREAVQRVEAVA